MSVHPLMLYRIRLCLSSKCNTLQCISHTHSKVCSARPHLKALPQCNTLYSVQYMPSQKLSDGNNCLYSRENFVQSISQKYPLNRRKTFLHVSHFISPFRLDLLQIPTKLPQKTRLATKIHNYRCLYTMSFNHSFELPTLVHFQRQLYIVMR